MGNPDHLAQLLKGASSWNQWRERNPKILIDLHDEDLSKAVIGIDDQAKKAGISLKNASWTFIKRELLGHECIPVNLSGANLQRARITNGALGDFSNADLEGADLNHANLSRANFDKANLVNTKLVKAHLNLATFRGANLDGANLTDASLRSCSLVRTSFVETVLSGCNLDDTNVYGAAVWNAQGEPSSQNNLTISPPDHARLTLDRIELAQFVFLLVKNRKIRDVISTLSSKSVLILGRFTKERKKVLDILSDQIRARNMLPIIFDWEPSENRDLTETVQLLASLCRFVLADLTDAKSIPQELSHIIPYFPSVPVLPIILTEQRPYAMFEHWRRYSSVLSEFSYDSLDHLLDNFDVELLEPLMEWEQRNIEGKAHSDKLELEVRLLRDELSRLRENDLK